MNSAVIPAVDDFDETILWARFEFLKKRPWIFTVHTSYGLRIVCVTSVCVWCVFVCTVYRCSLWGTSDRDPRSKNLHL